MNLVELRKADKNGKLPISINTAYKWNSIKRYPRLIVKVGGKLFFDFDEWSAMAETARNEQVKTAARLRNAVA